MAFADLLAMTDRAALQAMGSAIRYTPSPLYGQPVDVQGVFDAAYVSVDAGEAGVTSVGPAVFLRLEDLSSDPEDDDEDLLTVAVSGVAYKVREVQKDGMGGVRLFLHRRDE